MKFSKGPESFGITLVEIEMTSENLGKLNSTTMAKNDYPAEIRINGRSYKSEVSYAGRSTLHFFKKSYNIKFKDDEFRSHRSYRLSAQAYDTTLLKSLIGFLAFESLNVMSPDAEPATVYLNGKYLGLYVFLEPVDKDFFKIRSRKIYSLFKAKFGNATFNSDIISDFSEAFDIEAGHEQTSDLFQLIRLVNEPNSPKNQAAIKELLDVEAYLRWLAACKFLNHFDGINNNFFLFRGPGTSKFEFVPWDLDRIYENPPLSNEHSYKAGRSYLSGNRLTDKILSYDDFKERYIEILRDLIGKKLPLEKFLERLDSFAAQIKDAYNADRVLTAKDQNFDAEHEKLRKAITSWIEALAADVDL